MYSIVMDIFIVGMAEWQEDQGAFWDDAIKGSSGLQAALRRRLMSWKQTPQSPVLRLDQYPEIDPSCTGVRVPNDFPDAAAPGETVD